MNIYHGTNCKQVTSYLCVCVCGGGGVVVCVCVCEIDIVHYVISYLCTAKNVCVCVGGGLLLCVSVCVYVCVYIDIGHYEYRTCVQRKMANKK